MKKSKKTPLARKLRQSRGETITETLVAILIIALSSVILAAMTASSARTTLASNAAANDMYEQFVEAETVPVVGTNTESVELKITIEGVPATDEYTVYTSGGEGGPFSYWSQESIDKAGVTP